MVSVEPFFLLIFSLDRNVVIITESGTAMTTPINPNNHAAISIVMNMMSERTPNTLFMTTGTTMLFSVRCISVNKIKTASAAHQPPAVNATNTAGIPPKMGPI